MEQLNVQQIRDVIQSPKHREVLQKAVRNQNKVKFHTLVDRFPGTDARATEFLEWVKTLIPIDKYQVFRKLFRYPLKTTEITGTINDKLSRVFNGLDRVTNAQFIDNEVKDDQVYYFQTILDWFNRWETEGFEFSKTEFNSVLIVDMAAEKTAGDKYPEPYWYWLFAEFIIDYKIADPFKGTMEWIAFKQPNNKVVFIDAFSYRVFDTKDGSIPADTINPIIDNPHTLGYCPARFFWDVPLDIQAPDLKWNPILRVIESLEWFQVFYVNKHYGDLFNTYPIYSMVETDCNFSNEMQVCDGGFLRDKQTSHYEFDYEGNILLCPACSQKRLVGAGTVIQRPMPSAEYGDFDPIKKVDVDVNSLKYNVDEIKRLKNEIIYACTGSDGSIITTEAVNEDQVAANYEDQSQILRRYKKAFEDAMNWVGETICKLRYGDKFKSYDSSLGSNFYIQTETELRKQYQTAKASGASESELSALSQRIVETANRNDPAQMERMKILEDLEPYRLMTRAEVIDLASKGLISADDLQLKMNFDSLIKRFERENVNITEFGILTMPYFQRVNKILETLKSYTNVKTELPAGL